MPRQIYTPRILPAEQPDRCELCPLCGLTPKEQRRAGKRERYWCLGIFDGEKDEYGEAIYDENGVQQMTYPRLSSKSIYVSAQKVREGGHLHHRPCDYIWESWMQIPGRVFSIPTEVYNAYRIPFEREQMIKNFPKLPFRIRKRKT